MPSLESQHFGHMEYDANAEIEFPQGLPGFEGERHFVFVEPEDLKPVAFLQSIATPGLCFTTIPVTAIDANYDLQLKREDHKLLGGTDSLIALAILSGTKEGAPTANLLAPLAIHLANRRGVQAVRWDSKYSHAQPLGEALACS